MKILSDHDIRQQLDFADAIRVIEQVMHQRDRDQFKSPPRLQVGNDMGNLVFTIGGDARDGGFGFRVYPRFRGAAANSQFTALFDAANGTLKAIVLGDYLGAARTGAIGGVAINYLAPENAEVLAVIGAGLQAETQIRAACQVRQFKEIRVYSRTPSRVSDFVARMDQLVSPPVIALDKVENAIRDCQVLITATSSKSPVFDINDLPSEVHINAIGPKYDSSHELPAQIADRSPRWVTDSPQQIDSSGKPAYLMGQVEDLAAIVGSTSPESFSGGTCVFLSSGLAGTEPLVAETLL